MSFVKKKTVHLRPDREYRNCEKHATTRVSDLRKYIIEFRYADNDQIYAQDVELTPSEYKRVRRFLSQLLIAGEIRLVDPTDPQNIDFILYPVIDPDFLDFETLKQHWRDGSLLEMADRLRIRL